MHLKKEIAMLSPLVESLKKVVSNKQKESLLVKHPRVQEALCTSLLDFLSYVEDCSQMKCALYALAIIKQPEYLFACTLKKSSYSQITSLLEKIVALDRFYQNIGGVIGYQLKVLQLLLKKNTHCRVLDYKPAKGIDLSEIAGHIQKYVLAGILALDQIGEIYPVGGLGSRLNLISKTGKPLPAAKLPFLGKTLLEGLVRDIQAKEFLFFRLTGKSIVIPIAMMTSLERDNSAHIQALLEENQWFKRPKDSFRLFSQLSVPVVSSEGKWVLKAPLDLVMQPGGHGALWQTAEEKGIFDWFEKRSKQAVVVRQINNPLAGIDMGLLAFIGIGRQKDKTLGFITCERLAQAAEGTLVIKQQGNKCFLSHIEYTDFKQEEFLADYPANTNIIYAGIKKLRSLLQNMSHSEPIVNMKEAISSWTPTGLQKIKAGRLESTMQSLSNMVKANKQESLSTFVTYNARERTLSTTKRSFNQIDPLETPEKAFYDLLYTTVNLFKGYCGFLLQDFSTLKDYLNKGPSHVIVYHPALGPLYQLIAQKLRGGELVKGAELQLEIADLFVENLIVQGSLCIHAHHVLGHIEEGNVCYSQKTGKCVLKNVMIKNKGIDRQKTQCYWENRIKREESFQLILEGHSEFYAEDICFEGNQMIVVPDQQRWIAFQKTDGKIYFKKEVASWEWMYEHEGNQIVFHPEYSSNL